MDDMNPSPFTCPMCRKNVFNIPAPVLVLRGAISAMRDAVGAENEANEDQGQRADFQELFRRSL